MATTVNGSKSNADERFRLYWPNTVTDEQAAAILAALEAHGPADEATLQALLKDQILPNAGVHPSAVTGISVAAPGGGAGPRPAQVTSVKGSKSNADE